MSGKRLLESSHCRRHIGKEHLRETAKGGENFLLEHTYSRNYLSLRWHHQPLSGVRVIKTQLYLTGYTLQFCCFGGWRLQCTNCNHVNVPPDRTHTEEQTSSRIAFSLGEDICMQPWGHFNLTRENLKKCHEKGNRCEK